MEQNLLKKAIEICQENVEALNLAELQRLAAKSATNKPTMSQLEKTKDLNSRKYKYAQVHDAEACDREIQRMFGLIQHIFYNSETLLTDMIFDKTDEAMLVKSFVSQNAMTKSTALRRKKETMVGDMLINLFGHTIDQISITSVLEKCLECMTTVASQNKRFKNAFLQSCQALQGSKRNTCVKVVCADVLNESFQGNSRKMHLLFGFLKSASLSPEVVREVSKLKLIEDIQAQLQLQCKNEKDIKLLKSYLVHYSGFLAGYSCSDEGVKTVIALKEVFTHALFVIDTVTPPQGPEVTPLAQLVLNLLLFMRNSACNRVGKQHFIQD